MAKNNALLSDLKTAISGDIIETETIAVTTTGADGSASGSQASAGSLYGFLLDVYLDYHASAPATTDVTLAYTSPANGNILVVTNNATDGLYAPRKQTCDAAGAAITGNYDLFPLNGTLTLSVAQANALTGAVTARVRYLKTGAV